MNGKITEVTNVTYSNGKRVATLTETVTRADDCEQLGNLYFRLSDIYRRLDDESISSDLKESLEQDLGVVKGHVEEYTGYVKGYETV